MKTSSSTACRFAALAALMALTACGGGGGDEGGATAEAAPVPPIVPPPPSPPPSPPPPPPPPPVASATADVVAGPGFALGLKSDGSVVLLGSNMLLDRPPGAAIAGTSARAIDGLVATALSTSANYSLAVGANGLLYGWGVSNYGTLGGTEPNQSVAAPRALNGVDSVVSAAATANYSLAQRRDGSVWYWPGVVTITLTGPTVQPGQVADLSGASKVVRGLTIAPASAAGPLAIKSDGTVWRVGWDVTTVMGSAGPIQTFVGRARQVSGLAGVVDISCGTKHCLALLSSGSLVGWGSNAMAELGTGTTNGTFVETPVAVPGLAEVVSIGTTDTASMAVTRDGKVWTWGSYSHGQGSTPTLSTPTQLTALSGAVRVSGSLQNAAVLLADGSVWSWGTNGNGELGDGTHQDRTVPVRATGLTVK